jgi:integrase
MSVRKRTWTTAKGVDREAWLCDYADQHGKRHAKTFARKKDADAFIAKAKVEVAEGVHTADSASVTVADAAELWLATCRGRGLERATIAAYEQHARIHIVPVLGRTKLSRLTAPAVREFEDRLRTDDKSQAMVRKILTSLGSLLSHAQERGLVARKWSAISGHAARKVSIAARIGAKRAGSRLGSIYLAGKRSGPL